MPISRGGITGIMFRHQTGGPITGWAYNQDFAVFNFVEVHVTLSVFILQV